MKQQIKTTEAIFPMPVLMISTFNEDGSLREYEYERLQEVHEKEFKLKEEEVIQLLKKEFPEIRKKLWKEYFWSQSFCLLTTGGAPVEAVKQYIETQGEKDRRRK